MSETSKIAKVLTAALLRNGVSNEGPKGLTKAFLNSSSIPALTALRIQGPYHQRLG
jgi:hypothetical protein